MKLSQKVINVFLPRLRKDITPLEQQRHIESKGLKVNFTLTIEEHKKAMQKYK